MVVTVDDILNTLASLPNDVVERMDASSPYDVMFRNGVTPNGVGYQIKLPTEGSKRGRARQRHVSALNRAMERYNRSQENRARHLRHRTMTQGSVLYVTIVSKYIT